jgi:predicted pyridoxine 5'-phosphate oxidase superfamily flavin-nucleotide-binding protein
VRVPKFALSIANVMTSEVTEFIKKQKLGFIATVCPDGTPNLAPKGTTTVWDEDHLVFADIHSPDTVNNLRTNPSIEINVVDVFTRKGYRLKGEARIISEGPLFKAMIDSYGENAKKYTINNFVLVRVDRVIEITSPAYDTGATTDEIRKKWI